MSGRSLRVDLVANTSQFKSAMAESSRQMQTVNSEFRNAAAETDQYGNAMDKTSAKKDQLTSRMKVYESQIKTIKNEQKHWTQELKDGNITEEEHARIQQDLSNRLNNTEASMKQAEGALKRLNQEGKDSKMTFQEFDKKFRDVGKTMRDVGVKVGLISGAGFLAMKKVLGEVTGEAIGFEHQMAEVGAISSATGSEMELLKGQAKELGRTTVFTS